MINDMKAKDGEGAPALSGCTSLIPEALTGLASTLMESLSQGRM